MKAWKKIAIGAGVAVLLVVVVSFTVYQSKKNVVTVQTGKAQRQDLAHEPEQILRILQEGTERGRAVARFTIAETRRAMHLDYQIVSEIPQAP